MNRYNLHVSDEEFEAATLPAKSDQAAAAQGLGMTIAMGVPMLECISVVARATPNARLRWVLSQADRQIREGRSLTQGISVHPDVLDEGFVQAVKRGEDEGTLDMSLLQYARSGSKTPNQMLADRIGRSGLVDEFITEMATLLTLRFSVADALAQAREESSSDFCAVIGRLISAYAEDQSLGKAVAAEDEIFDPIFIDMVRAGEMGGKLERAFHLLALP